MYYKICSLGRTQDIIVFLHWMSNSKSSLGTSHQVDDKVAMLIMLCRKGYNKKKIVEAKNANDRLYKALKVVLCKAQLVLQSKLLCSISPPHFSQNKTFPSLCTHTIMMKSSYTFDVALFNIMVLGQLSQIYSLKVIKKNHIPGNRDPMALQYLIWISGMGQRETTEGCWG